MGKLIKNDGINKIKIVLDFHSSENNQKDSFFSDKEGNPISDKIVTSIFQIIILIMMILIIFMQKMQISILNMV